MNFIQQEINSNKSKLLNLVNNLINTVLINEGIIINNEIKNVCEYLGGLLNQKQNYLINQMNLNNNNINNNLNPLFFQPNQMMNPQLMNVNPFQMEQAPIMQNNFNNLEDEIIISFKSDSGIMTFVKYKPDEKVCDAIKKYRTKTNNFGDNIYFLFNTYKIDEESTVTLTEAKIKNGSLIYVRETGILKGGKFNN